MTLDIDGYQQAVALHDLTGIAPNDEERLTSRGAPAPPGEGFPPLKVGQGITSRFDPNQCAAAETRGLRFCVSTVAPFGERPPQRTLVACIELNGNEMDEAQRAIILNLLAHHNIMTLATIRPDGFPQATIVYYVNEGLTLYFATDPASQKAGNIKLNNKVSVAIVGETENANKLKAISLSGTATRIVEPQRLQALQLLLFRAVPGAKRFAPKSANELAVYSITPTVMSLVDYATGYGKTFLVEL